MKSNKIQNIGVASLPGVQPVPTDPRRDAERAAEQKQDEQRMERVNAAVRRSRSPVVSAADDDVAGLVTEWEQRLKDSLFCTPSSDPFFPRHQENMKEMKRIAERL